MGRWRQNSHIHNTFAKACLLDRNYLGRNAPEHARVAAVAALGVGAACALITATAMGLNSKTWSRVFTDDPAVTLLVQKVVSLVSTIKRECN